MRKKVLLAACGALVFVGLATAGAAAPSTPSASLPASSALERLIATGELPADVTGEPGVWNFAGPASACPGPGWNCTTLGVFPVVQTGTVNVIQCVVATCVGSSQTGAVNTFECEPATSTTGTADQSCTISQETDAVSNVAKCVLKKKTTGSSWSQLCKITQRGQHNDATVVEVIEQTGSPIQGALQEAIIKQTGTGSTNQLQVDQEIKQFSESGENKDQDAYQVVRGPDGLTSPALQTQTLLASPVFNQAQIDQKQIQRARGGTMQTQNNGSYGPGVTLDEPDDCDPLNNPPEPHACINLDQYSEGGDNESQLSQTIDEDAATAVVATQQQGVTPVDPDPDPPPTPPFLFIFPGGVDGRVHQETSAPGSSQREANQSKPMNVAAPPGSTQFQFDPGECCGFSTVGPGSDQIEQFSTTTASEEDAVQIIMLTGVSNGNLDTTCAIAQGGQNNADTSSGSFSADPCTFLVVETMCTNPPPPPPFEGPPTPACTTQGGLD